MALELHDPDLDALAHEVSSLTGETVAEVVRIALRERLASERSKRRAKPIERFAALPVLDPRSPDEILGYDENGLPS